MSDLVTKVLTGVLRVVMAPILTWLINKNIITSDESVKLVAEVFAYAVPIAWAIWAWIRSHKEVLTALTNRVTTMQQVKAVVASGQAPAVSTPNNVQPTLQEKAEVAA